MLPIPCTLSCAPGLPAILLVNPPTEIVGSTAGDDVEPAAVGPGGVHQLTPDNAQIRGRQTAASSTMKRLSVTRMNFYVRYLQPRSRRATQRERKATKTLAIVLGKLT